MSMTRVSIAAMVWLACAVLRAAAPVAQNPPKGLGDSLPPGDGRAEVIKYCADCHDLETATAKRRSLTVWEDVIDTMVVNGLSVPDADYTKVSGYLARAFGRVNVNTDDSKNLVAVLELTPEVASALIKGRPYKTVQDLSAVPGIDAKALETRKERIVF